MYYNIPGNFLSHSRNFQIKTWGLFHDITGNWSNSYCLKWHRTHTNLNHHGPHPFRNSVLMHCVFGIFRCVDNYVLIIKKCILQNLQNLRSRPPDRALLRQNEWWPSSLDHLLYPMSIPSACVYITDV